MLATFSASLEHEVERLRSRLERPGSAALRSPAPSPTKSTRTGS